MYSLMKFFICVHRYNHHQDQDKKIPAHQRPPWVRLPVTNHQELMTYSDFYYCDIMI